MSFFPYRVLTKFPDEDNIPFGTSKYRLFESVTVLVTLSKKAFESFVGVYMGVYFFLQEGTCDSIAVVYYIQHLQR